jgi:hypothetical protein
MRFRPALSGRRSAAFIGRFLFLHLLFGLGTPACGGDGPAFRIALDEAAYDARHPGPYDFLDCPGPDGPCQAVLFPRAMADEKVVLPRGTPLESLRFLSLKGIRAQGGDPVLTLALRAVPEGDSVYVDFDDDEDLGNDGPGRFWPKKDSCATLVRPGGSMPPLMLCRDRSRRESPRARCEEMKDRLSWALCDDPAYRARLLDIRSGWMEAAGKHWWIGLNDADGDGRYRLGRGDRLVIDWNGDGILEKSADAEGVAGAPGEPARFSLDSLTFEAAGADESGEWIELRRLAGFDPAAAASRIAEGRPAPELRFVNMDGDTVRLADLKGKKVLLHFWSTLCKPCLDQMEAVRSFWKAFGSRNWEVVSLTAETDLPAVQQAVLKHHMDWTVGMAGPEARRFYANRPLPVAVKIDARGVVEKRDMPLGARSF